MSKRKAFQESLPKKRMAAGALFLNEKRQLLLVNPTYRPDWLIPGGIVEKDESPRQACMREVREELGLDVEPERLLSVAWQSASEDRTESLQFIFWGGMLTRTAIERIQLPTVELSEFDFFDVNDALSLLHPGLASRVKPSYEVIDTARTLYFDL